MRPHDDNTKTDGTRARPFSFPGEARQSVGLNGEKVASVWLARQGYRVLASRQRIAGVEIDVVAEIGGETVLVEVKTRTGESFGAPEESVGVFRRERLRRAALSFAAATGRPVRIDVIAVILPARPGEPARLRHIPYAVGESE